MAVIHFDQPVRLLHITPVIYITNKTFDKTADTAIKTLAINCYNLVSRLAAANQINYTQLQIDCDWTLSTRAKYFSFLTAIRKLSGKQVQATIRLHQVKYKERTGVPPVDRGVLMFYNMGKLNADLKQPNSIYNPADAAKYIDRLNAYPLKLDVALPMFSWAIQIRNGRAIQVYGKIGESQLAKAADFELITGDHIYRAKHSFFLTGIYVKQNDIFKFEQVNAATLNTAAKQLAAQLSPLPNRTIIYYELANIALPEFDAETIRQVSDRF
jgi:hypothetical protein